jgi:lipopolysaccharide transport system permease protein
MFSAVVDMADGLGRWRTSFKLALQDVELRYRRSLLGPFWISAALIATVLALAYVFAKMFHEEFGAHASFVGAGLLAWYLILGLVNEGSASITEHASLLQNVRMPATTIAGRIVLRNGIVFLHNLTAMVCLLPFLHTPLSTTALMVFPGALVILCFGFFLAMALGPLCARFRDLPLVIQSGMQVIFFLTPIFWPTAAAGRPILSGGNPFFHLIELVRAPLLGHPATALSWQVALWCCAGAAVLALISVALTRKRVNLWL